MKSKRFWLLGLSVGFGALLLSLSGCQPGTGRDDHEPSSQSASASPNSGGNLKAEAQVSKHPKVDRFDTVRNVTYFNVEYTQGPTFEVSLEGSDEDLSQVKIRNLGSTLELGVIENARSTGPITVHVKSPILKEFELVGSGNATLEGIKQDQIRLNLHGSGNIRVSGKSRSVAVDLSGSGDVDAKELGVQNADLNLAGSGNLLVQTTGDVKVDLSGSGQIHVGSPKNLKVFIGGSGDVYYSGHPTIEQDISGAGSVHKE